MTRNVRLSVKKRGGKWRFKSKKASRSKDMGRVIEDELVRTQETVGLDMKKMGKMADSVDYFTELKRIKDLFPDETGHSLTVNCIGEHGPCEEQRLACEYLAPSYKEMIAFVTLKKDSILEIVRETDQKAVVGLMLRDHPTVRRWLTTCIDFMVCMHHTGHPCDGKTFRQCLSANRKMFSTLIPHITPKQFCRVLRQARQSMRMLKQMLKKEGGELEKSSQRGGGVYIPPWKSFTRLGLLMGMLFTTVGLVGAVALFVPMSVSMSASVAGIFIGCGVNLLIHTLKSGTPRGAAAVSMRPTQRHRSQNSVMARRATTSPPVVPKKSPAGF